MSCYEWEHGHFKLPTKAYPSFRKGLIKIHNDLELARLAAAKQAFTKIKAASKGQKDKHIIDFMNQISNELGISYALADLIVKNDGTGKWKLRQPKKKDLSIRLVSKDCEFAFEDASIRFAKGYVYWDVMENNHARTNAHAHPMAKAFFRALDKVVWTRGSGGIIIGNDEYNRDSGGVGGGGNYLVAAYGPLGKKESVT
jgi:hypothetical protein